MPDRHWPVRHLRLRQGVGVVTLRPDICGDLHTEIVGSSLSYGAVPTLVAMGASADVLSPAPFTLVLAQQCSLAAVRQLVDDKVLEALRFVEHNLVAAETALMAVAENEALGAERGVIAGVAVVRSKLDRREYNTNRERIERLSEQLGRPFEHDFGGLTAGVAEHSLVGVAHGIRF